MTTVLVSLGTAGLTLAAIALVTLFARRSGAEAEERVSLVIRDLSERMEAMKAELSGSLEQTREESRRTRFLGELAGSIDLDEVVSRTLDAAEALPGVDASLVTLARAGREPLIAAVGLEPQEAEEYAISAPARGRRLSSLSAAYDGPEGTPPEAGAITAGLAMPLRGEKETLGLLTVFSRAALPQLEDAVSAELEELALRAGPAVENAQRFREARQLADLDALTGLHNRRYFHETLAREIARGHRYSRRLALLVFDLDDFKAINDRIGHLAGDTVLAEVADRVRDVVRSADVSCRVGGDEFGVIMPESAHEDADQLYRRLQAAITAVPPQSSGNLTVSAGVAELRPDDDAVSFFQRADEALYRAKAAGKGRVAAETSAS